MMGLVTWKREVLRMSWMAASETAQGVVRDGYAIAGHQRAD
jgi:hypothetical protein